MEPISTILVVALFGYIMWKHYFGGGNREFLTSEACASISKYLLRDGAMWQIFGDVYLKGLSNEIAKEGVSRFYKDVKKRGKDYYIPDATTYSVAVYLNKMDEAGNFLSASEDRKELYRILLDLIRDQKLLEENIGADMNRSYEVHDYASRVEKRVRNNLGLS